MIFVFFLFDSIPNRYKTQEICDKALSKEPLILKHCLDRYNTEEMCGKAIDVYLSALKFVPDWFVTNKMLEQFDDIAFSNDDMDLDSKDTNIVIFFSDGVGLDTIDLNNINLDDDKFDDDDPEGIIHNRLMAWCKR